LTFIFSPSPQVASADEGGHPFWILGLYAAMAVVPRTPSWFISVLPDKAELRGMQYLQPSITRFRGRDASAASLVIKVGRSVGISQTSFYQQPMSVRL
jgi:hypothetical protein